MGVTLTFLQLLVLLVGLHPAPAPAMKTIRRRQDIAPFSYSDMKEEVARWTKFITDEDAFKPQLSRSGYRQKRISSSQEFPCTDTSTYRSTFPPTSVHALRPGDIDVVAAIGDSLVAGDAALEDSALGVFIQYRGVSWCVGGQGTWRQYLTIPNILKVFNPNVTGYSWGEGSFQAKNSRFNIAMPAALDDDTEKQARILVARIKKDTKIDFNNSWKLVTIFIGHNDLCSKACFDPVRHSAMQHGLQLQRALDYLQKNLPRTFVNLVSIADVTFSLRLQRTMLCRLMHPLLCACMHRGPQTDHIGFVAQLGREYARVEKELVASGRYDKDPQFTVVIQPTASFSHELGYTRRSLSAEGANSSWMKEENLIGPDCFHMSQAGSAIMANMNWNNFFEPVGNKTIIPPEHLFQRFLCPTPEAPYLFTNLNSGSPSLKV